MIYKPVDLSDQGSSPILLNIGPTLQELDEEILKATTKFIQQVPCTIFPGNPFAILSPNFFHMLDKKEHIIEWIDLLEALTAKFPSCVYKEMLETMFTISQDNICTFNHVIRLINTFCMHTNNATIIGHITEEEIANALKEKAKNVK